MSNTIQGVGAARKNGRRGSALTLLDVVVLEGAAILELLTREDETLLVRRDALLILDLGLDSLDSVGALDLEGDGLSRKGLNEDLRRRSRI